MKCDANFVKTYFKYCGKVLKKRRGHVSLVNANTERSRVQLRSYRVLKIIQYKLGSNKGVRSNVKLLHNSAQRNSPVHKIDAKMLYFKREYFCLHFLLRSLMCRSYLNKSWKRQELFWRTLHVFNFTFLALGCWMNHPFYFVKFKK